MTARPKITIDFAGLKPNEVSVLKSMCIISRQAARSFSFEVATDPAIAHILVLDNSGVVAPVTLGPVVRGVLWVGQSAPLSRSIPSEVVQRPLLASRVLSALDKLVPSLKSAVDVEALASQHDAKASRAFRRVLVVDDSPTLRKQVERVLAGLRVQVQVLSVASGEGALDMVRRKHFDLVLLDVVLPQTDGYSVCRSIKRHPRTRHIPVVMLTGKSTPFDKIRGTLAGCEGYLTKPVNREEFEHTVMRYLDAPDEVTIPYD